MGTIVKREVTKMHKPLVLKCFRFLLENFSQTPMLWLSVKLDNICRDLRHSKQPLVCPHCYSASVLMVILVTMCPGVVTILTTEPLTWGRGVFLRPITGHTPSDHNEAIFKLVKIFDRLFIFGFDNMSVKAAGQPT